MPVAEAFGVYRRYYGFVRHALLRNNVAEADIEDAVHEVFIVLLRKLGPDADGEDLRAWLFEVSRRIASNRRRAVRRHERKRKMAVPDRETPTPEDAAVRRQAAQRLARFIDTLEPRDRTVFIMAEIEGAPGRVIARRLGEKLHVAYRRMRSVRARFEEEFGKCVRRHGRLQSWLLLPRWLATPSWSPLLAPAALAATLIPEPATPPTVPDPLPSPTRALIRDATVLASADEVIVVEDEAIDWDPDEIVVLPDRKKRRPSADPFERALTRALATDEEIKARHIQIQVTPVPPDPSPRPRPRPRPTPTRPDRPKPTTTKAAPWTGAFVDEHGHPIADARILCRQRTTSGLRRRCFPRRRTPRTDHRGRVTIDFDPGTYELIALPDDQLRTSAPTTVVEID